MIENANVSPYADERQCKARFDLYLPDKSLLRSYPSQQILQATLIQECYIEQSGIPRSQLNITLDNRDLYFNVSDKNNARYILDEYSPSEFYLSSALYGEQAEFILKGRHFFSRASESKNSITLEYTDMLSQSRFTDDKDFYITDVFDDIGKTSSKARDILQGGIAGCKYSEGVYIPDELNNTTSFSRNSFLNDSDGTLIRDGFYNIRRRLSTSSKKEVRLIISDDGTLRMVPQALEVAEVLYPRNYVDYEILPGKSRLIAKVRDRGNVLRQLGDVVELHDGSKVFKIEIYKQAYNYQSGILSAEWEGLIL